MRNPFFAELVRLQHKKLFCTKIARRRTIKRMRNKDHTPYRENRTCGNYNVGQQFRPLFHLFSFFLNKNFTDKTFRRLQDLNSICPSVGIEQSDHHIRPGSVVSIVASEQDRSLSNLESILQSKFAA